MTPNRRLREDTCSRDLRIIRKDPIIRRHCTRWAMGFVVVRYYDRIRYGLRNHVILIIFDGENDPGKESAIP